jgi:hypothetical protein
MMDTLNNGQPVQDIYTPLGLIHVWQEKDYGWQAARTVNEIHFTFPEDEGGLTLPSGKVIYSAPRAYYDVPRWSSYTGFINSSFDRSGQLAIRTRITKSRQPTFSWHAPEMLELSDMLFDLLIAGNLPIPFVSQAYHLQNRDFLREYYEKYHAVEELQDELNKLGKIEGTRIYRELYPSKDKEASHIPVFRLMR